MAIYSFEGNAPQIAESAYVHESAQIIGDLVIGGECFIKNCGQRVNRYT